ncbi:hypothetical protein PIROE2DRAFT_66712 [Piromyces sp. E2]|nr:hypothetical protein PIROE2DRAFT_66712 [Piromyces sp. E2]|eukprot:OUM70315.1 hypothetical protein PIROE2DRAFT_66712 [Piromyces sp. E2]
MELAKQTGEEKLVKYMNKPKPIHEIKKKLNENKKSGGFFGSSKKNSDEKLDEYIKNYQVNNFKEDYKELYENFVTYSPIEDRDFKIEEQLALAMYIAMGCCNYYSLNIINPRETLRNREVEYYNRKNIKSFSYIQKHELRVLRNRLIFDPYNLDLSVFNVNEILMYGMPTIHFCN